MTGIAAMTQTHAWDVMDTDPEGPRLGFVVELPDRDRETNPWVAFVLSPARPAEARVVGHYATADVALESVLEVVEMAGRMIEAAER